MNNNRITANGTGIHVTDGGSLTSVTENFVTGNTGDGILITATAGSVAPVFNNDLSGNGGLAVNNQSATTVDAAGNWWGTSTAAGVAAEISGNVDFSPWLTTGTDTGRAPGFQGDFSKLTVNATSPRHAGQTTGNLQEGVDQVTAGGTVNVAGRHLPGVRHGQQARHRPGRPGGAEPGRPNQPGAGVDRLRAVGDQRLLHRCE